MAKPRENIAVYSAQRENRIKPLFHVSFAEAKTMLESGEARTTDRGRALRLLELQRLSRLPAAQILTIADVLHRTMRARMWQRIGQPLGKPALEQAP
jgi:hypothetical protein